MRGRLSDTWLNELRSRVRLEEVVSEYVPLKQKGRRYWGCCPFHTEKTPSFSVNVESQQYYCFGCHKGGTVINFVMEVDHMDFMEAVKMLAERVHMELPQGVNNEAYRRRADERERIFEANTLAARFFHSNLWEPDGFEVLNYLYGRGLADSDIRRFGLGASPRGQDTLYQHLKKSGCSTEILLKAGLVVKKADRIYDMFRERAIFPIINARGEVLGFGGRAMGSAQPKYLNTADTPVFNKRQGLYALNMVKKERNLARLVLVEGYMDTVSLRKYGVTGVVATLGTALTQEQARLMKRYVSEVWVSYDGDPPGQKAALRALDIFDAEDLRAKVIDYPDGMDPDDFIRANGLVGFEQLPKLEGTEYRMLRAKDGLDMATQDGVTEYAMRCCKILKALKRPIEAENYLRKLANETGYDRETLLAQIGATQAETPILVRTYVPPQERNSDAELAECELITLLSRGLIPSEAVQVEDFSSDVRKRLVECLIQEGDVNAILEEMSEEERSMAAEALNYEPIPAERDDALKAAQELQITIRKNRLNARIAQIQSEIKTAGQEEKLKLYEQMAKINKQLEN